MAVAARPGAHPRGADKATGKTERDTRSYITSLQPGVARLNQAIRKHWGIENKLNGCSLWASAKTTAEGGTATQRKPSP